MKVLLLSRSLRTRGWVPISPSALKLGSFMGLFFYLNPKVKKQRHYFATKVHLVKAMVFPVVMYGCESWDCEEG